MKKLILLMMAVICGHHLSAQTFTTEFSAEMQRVEGKIEVAPQLKGILELPFGKGWGSEWELTSSQAGLDYRIDAKRELIATLSLLAGASSGDACHVHFADVGLGAAWEKWETTAILHYAPFATAQDKYLELTLQRNLRCLYLQPGLYVNHIDKTVSLTGVITLGISLDIK